MTSSAVVGRAASHSKEVISINSRGATLFSRQPQDSTVRDPQPCIVAHTTPEGVITRILDVGTYPEFQIGASEETSKKCWSWDEAYSNTINMAVLAEVWRLTIAKKFQEPAVSREQPALSFFEGQEGLERVIKLFSDAVYTINSTRSLAHPAEYEVKADQAQGEPELDINAQFDELRSLENGWLDGEGLAPSRQGIDWLEQEFRAHYPSAARLPYLFPTVIGGIQAEWSIGRREITFEIDLTNRSGHWHELCLETGDVVERSLDGNAANDWDWLVQRVELDI